MPKGDCYMANGRWMIGKNYITVKGRKLTVKLKFNGNDLQYVIDGKKKKGKVVLASLVIK